MSRFFKISSCTFGVAVAVNPITGISVPNCLIMWRRFRYSGLKSCPHSEIQCASSMATKETGTLLRNSTYSSFVNDSGATYKSLVIPETISFLT